MNSIAARLFVVASLVLATFVILTSLAVRHSVHQRAENALYSKMQGMIYGILGAAELVDDAHLQVNEAQLPEQSLLSPVTGIYAEVRDSGNNIVWSSRSTVNSIPAIKSTQVGKWSFVHTNTGTEEEVRALQFQAIYVAPTGAEPRFTIQVVEDAVVFAENLAGFNRNLWVTLAIAALALLLVLASILAWGLKPLRDIGRNLKLIESGASEQLDTKLPHELQPLASSINTLILSERNRQLRYRNVIDDLAHSLKTPLSVLSNISDAGIKQADNPIITDQTKRMQSIISYHLQRAQAGNRKVLAAPLSPEPTTRRLADSLKKIYSSENDALVDFTIDIEPDFQLRIDESDLFEMLGNVMENACKYGASNVIVTAKTTDEKRQISVADDGPGFPPSEIEELSQRGRRADSQREGQGLGLALTAELVESYGGTLQLINRSVGGAEILMNFSR